MTDNDWIKQLQSKMEGHQEPVPDDLWQDIEKRLPGARRPLMPWVRRAAAAAVVAAVVGVGSLMWHNSSKDNEPSIPLATTTAVTTEAKAIQEQLAQNEQDRHDDNEPATTNRVSPSALTASTGRVTSDRVISDQVTNDDEEQQAVPEATEAPPANPPTEQARQPKEQPHQGRVKEPPATTLPHQYLPPTTKKANITVGLYASNSVKTDRPSSSNDYLDGEVLAPDPDPDNPYIPEDIFTAKHHAPITMGLSVRLPLTDRLALTSGLVYTRLKSDFTSIRKHREQTLHYLGIPLGVTYNVWSYKRFSIYAVGGVQADFNIKATLKQSFPECSLSIDKDDVQFSALVGPGLQLDVTKEFGIYVEPTARYYFDNGSNVDNYYKDMPWNLNFNAGLRLTLK